MRRILLLSLLALAATLIGVAAGPARAGLPVVDDDAPPRGVMARYMLTDHHGRPVSEESFRGQFQLIAFGYTHCPDICPTTLVDMGRILKLLGDLGERVQPLFITVDPERDTAEHLAEYVPWFHPRILGLTGARPMIERVAFNFKVRFRKVQEPGAPPDHYAMDHSAGLYLVGPEGQFIARFAYGESPAAVAERLRPMLEQLGDAAQR